MATTLTSKGQVTIPKRIRNELQLLPGAPVEFSVNVGGKWSGTGLARSRGRGAHPRTGPTPCEAAQRCAGKRMS
jgi:AbrB family looped-hinge helix DNA binding protein